MRVIASTYSTLLRFELPTTGELSGSWGNTMDNFIGVLLEHAIAGNLAKVLADADYTLTTLSGSTDEARYQGITFTGALTATRNITLPTAQKHYQFFNNTSQSLVFKTAAGASVTLTAGLVARVFCDGAGVFFTSMPVLPATGLPPSLTISTGTFTTLNVSGVSSLGTTPSGSTPLVVTASTNAVGFELKGRAADGIGILRFMNNAGTTELARLQSGAGVGTIAIAQGSTAAIVVLSTDTTGNVLFPKAITVGTGLTVSAGGLTVAAAGASITGNVTLPSGDLFLYRSGAPTTGVVYLGNSNARYLYYDGTQYNLPGAQLLVNGFPVWTTGTFNPAGYAPLSGAVFSGSVYVDSGVLSVRSSGSRHLYFKDSFDAEWGLIYHDVGTNQLITRVGGGSGGTCFFGATGNFTASANVYAFSDRRLKTDFRPLTTGAAIVEDLADAVSRYRWISDPDRRDQLGLIAQDVQRTLPEAVNVQADGTLAVTDRPIVAALVATVAELLGRVRTLEAAHG